MLLRRVARPGDSVADRVAFVDPLAEILALTTLQTAGATIRPPPAETHARLRRGLTRTDWRQDEQRIEGRRASTRLFADRFLTTRLIVTLGGTARAVRQRRELRRRRARRGRAGRAPPPHPARDRAEDRAAGCARCSQPVWPVMLAAVGALLFVSASMTAEVSYVKDVLGAGDAGYAMFAASTLGIVLGALALPQRVRRRDAAFALLALGVPGFGIAAQTVWAVLPAALAGYLVGGVGHGLKNALVRTVIAERVANAAHGRAFAAYNAARNAAELGALGPAARSSAGRRAQRARDRRPRPDDRRAGRPRGATPPAAAAGERRLLPRLQPSPHDA